MPKNQLLSPEELEELDRFYREGGLRQMASPHVITTTRRALNQAVSSEWNGLIFNWSCSAIRKESTNPW